MAQRIIQYEHVAKAGLMGAIKQGDFLAGTGVDISDPYLKQSIALWNMHRDNSDGVYFNYLTGEPEELSSNVSTANFKCGYKLPVTPEAGELVVRFNAPEYMQGQKVIAGYISGGNFETDLDPQQGSALMYIDEACTVRPNMVEDYRIGYYFFCPEVLYFKIRAGVNGSTAYPVDLDETAYYSRAVVLIQYTAKDDLNFYK